MEPMREDPDMLLRRIAQEDKKSQRGRLKIFFGYAAGVGKTYAMLKAAHAASHRGIDVVVGYVEPHARVHTMEMLNGLEVLPTKQVQYRDIQLREFDLDLALKRRPQLILVDELAHTNAEGCRHAKRYQDIEELLNMGIDVYTTVNVQHIESLNDIVASITGVSVRERIPDHVFDNADQVELVDIEPQDLIERLHAGNVYCPQQAGRALENFFSLQNLVALREIALRRCADRINKLAEKVKTSQSGDYYTDEHILVCLSSSPSNAKIIRTGARMASAFKGGFTALFVETSAFASMSEENRNRLRKHIHLAQQLGATIETVYGDDIAFQIAEFARLSGVSKIVMGRSNLGRRFLWSKPPLTEQLTAYAPNLDIYIIPEKNLPPYRGAKPKGKGFAFSWRDAARTLAILAVATAAGFLFDYLGFSEANIITIYILGVLITAIVTSQRGYSLVSSIISVLLFNYLFTTPRFTFFANDIGHTVTFVIMFAAAFITSSLAAKLKQVARRSVQSAYRTRILLETNQMLQQSSGKDQIVSQTAQQLTKLVKKDIVFYLPQGETLAPPSVFLADEEADAQECITENERAVAHWVYKNNKRAGAFTGTLGNAKCLYLAVRVNERVYGVVGIHLKNQPLDTFENSIVLSILGECALALENQQILLEREQAAILAKNEQLRANLLRSISHDLRTPLTSISGNAGILLANDTQLAPQKRQQLYKDIYEDSLWLINLVENLLSVTRIEDGSMQLNKTAELMEEVIDEALRHVNRREHGHAIKVHQPQEIVLAQMDARLIVQVVVNILDNAIKYTPKGSEILVDVAKDNDWVTVRISDNGPGIPDEAKTRIFDMFYTLNNTVADSRRSLGLGLALCKSIINAHGGEIWVQDHKPQGTTFCFTLPAQEVPDYEP